MQRAQFERAEILGRAAHVIAEALVFVTMKLAQTGYRTDIGLADTTEQRGLAVVYGPAAHADHCAREVVPAVGGGRQTEFPIMPALAAEPVEIVLGADGAQLLPDPGVD